MSIRAISSAVNASFVRSFQGLAGSDGPKIGAGAGEGASIYSGLRLGARTFATSIQNLNSAIGIVNVADSTLKKLSTVVDDMIGLAEKATSVSAGAESRRKLQADFDKLVDQFRDIVGESEFSGVEYLTEEGLALLFQRVGLDKESSDGVAAVLAQFVKPDSEDSFASEETKGPRPPNVPVLRKSKALQTTNESLNPAAAFGISADYTVYNYPPVSNPYEVTVVTPEGNNIYSGANQELQVVNESYGNSPGETSGYSIVRSDMVVADNPSGYNQLFLVDTNLINIRQITSVNDASEQVSGLSISADNNVVAYSVYNSDTNVSGIQIVQVSNIAEPPVIATVVDYIDLGWPASVSSAKLSNNAESLLYAADDGAVMFREVGVTTTNIGVSSPIDYGFADSRTGVFLDSTGTNIFSYNFDTSEQTTLIAGSNITHLEVLEVDSNYSINDGATAGTPKISTLAYITSDDGRNELTVMSYDLNTGTLKTRFRRDLGAGTVDGISLAYQNDQNSSKDRVDVGIKGNLPVLFGDSDTEIYRIKEAKFATNSSLFSAASSDPSKILDGNLFTRADSYRLLGDLKALKSQISDNLEALSDARDYIANNVELVRNAGFAFLKISDQLKGSEDAETVARMLASEIRKNATQAQAAQAENLTSIVSQTTALLDSAS